MYENIKVYFNSLKQYGPGHGNYPKHTKIILIMHLDNIKTGKQIGLCHRFKVCTGAHYLGSFIGDNDSKRVWIQDLTSKWENNICIIRKMEGKRT